METLLEVKNLRTYFHLRNSVVKAVDGISFSLFQNETVGLVGESGSGKSVTALSILGLVARPGVIEEGEAFFRGRDLLKIKEEMLRKEIRGREIGMIFQNPTSSLNPVMKVGYQIARVHRNHFGTSWKESEQLALEYLRLVRIPDPERVMGRYPHQLSGGMCQRAMIAMALICEPALMIADEPTTSLDVTVQEQIMDLMKQLREKTQASQLLITHDLGVIAETCDRMVVMYCGKIMEIGDVRSVYREPLHPYTRALLGSVPDIRKDFRTKTIPGKVPDPRDPPSGCRFHPRCELCVEICREKIPELVEYAPGRWAACHFAKAPEKQPLHAGTKLDETTIG